MADIAAIVARRAGVPAVSITPDDAQRQFGWFAGFAMMDNIASSAWRREQLGWRPVDPGLLADLDRDEYVPLTIGEEGNDDRASDNVA